MKTGPKGKPGARTRTAKQKEKRKNAKNRVMRKEARSKLPGNVKRAEEQAAADQTKKEAALFDAFSEEEIARINKADAAKMQAKMEAPIPEASVDPIDNAVAPGQDVVTTSL